MHRFRLSMVLSLPGFRLLRGVPWPTRLSLVAAVGAAGLVAWVPAGPASAAGSCTTGVGRVTCTYGFTGGEQTFTVPSGVSSVQVTALGAAGAPSFGSPAPPGGEGALVTGTLTGLTAGEVLYVEVGGTPVTGACNMAVSCVGGFNGGGFSGFGGGGGGASDVRTISSANAGSLASRLIVAAGGGGGGEPGSAGCDPAGTAGGDAGAMGGTSSCVGFESTGGEPGTQTAGGAGGSPLGGPGALGVGGIGGDLSGGAGGGGLYGGGGGGEAIVESSVTTASGGGGGGSSLVPSGGTASLTSSPASVTISYSTVAPLSVTTTSLPAATGGRHYTATLAATGGVTPYSWSVPPGTLPPGLSLSAAGVISGVPDVAGTYPFTVEVTDAESPAMTATTLLSISVSGPVIAGLRPDHGPSFGGTLVQITGSGLACPRFERFFCRVSVTFDSHRAFVLFATPTQILVIAPPGHGTVQVTVNVGGVSSQATSAGLFTYRRIRFPL